MRSSSRIKSCRSRDSFRAHSRASVLFSFFSLFCDIENDDDDDGLSSSSSSSSSTTKSICQRRKDIVRDDDDEEVKEPTWKERNKSGSTESKSDDGCW